MKKKKIILSLINNPHFSSSCKVVEMLPGLTELGYDVDIIFNKWSREAGLVYDKSSSTFVKGESCFLWDPKTHPKDFFENLIASTFPNVRLVYSRNIIERILDLVQSLLSPRVFNNTQIILMYADHFEKESYIQLKLNTKNPFAYLFHYFSSSDLIMRLKIKPRSQPFRYKLSPKLYDSKVKDILRNEKKNSTIHVIVSASWDDKKKYETQNDRLRGIYENEISFKAMVNFVDKIDRIACKDNRVRIVLVSKKAVDWSNRLKSDFLDLRSFEKLGLTLSQCIFITQELANITVNWPNTFTIWITNCGGIVHQTWNNYKDTALWARNFSVMSADQAIDIAMNGLKKLE
jgi:hypothetical protein